MIHTIKEYSKKFLENINCLSVNFDFKSLPRNTNPRCTITTETTTPTKVDCKEKFLNPK